MLIIDVLANISILPLIKRVGVFTLEFVSIATDFILEPESKFYHAFCLIILH